jgi:hypothetical protein
MRIRVRIDGVLHPDVLIPKALQSLVEGELNYKLVRRRRSEA